MTTEEDITDFIGASFRSVWSLELLCHLRKEPSESFSPEALVAGLRASDLVVRQSLAELVSAGLIVVEGDGRARYAPVSADLDELAEGAESLYGKAPNAVRRVIVNAANPGAAAFANAFRLKRDK
jgi:DNA-binding GntR family transcriptional regulator